MRAHLFLLGYRRYRIPLQDAPPYLALWQRIGFSPKTLKRDEKTDTLVFECSLFAARRMLAALPPELTPPVLEKSGGLPCLLRRFCLRPGLVLGTVLGLFLLILSQLFVWDVRVECDPSLEEGEVLEALAAAGLSRGSFIPQLSGDAISATLRRADRRFSYVGVQLEGTVAKVKVLENREIPEKVVPRPANLVARCDGVITLPLVFEGECQVEIGDTVRAGQILASGVLNSEVEGVRLTRAAGEVLARTTRTYRIFVPFAYKEQVYTGKERSALTLHFFGKDRNIFNFTNTIERECDIIRKTQYLQNSDGYDLPIGFTKTVCRAYEWRDATRTATQARSLALEQLSAAIAADGEGRTLLWKSTELSVDEQGVTLLCTLVCEENIAATQDLLLG